MAVSIWQAVLRDDPKMARCLIRRGANVEECDRFGNSALLVASLVGHHAVATCLLLEGADPNAVNRSGESPLHWAVRNGHFDIIELLIHFGSDAALTDENGNSAFDILHGVDRVTDAQRIGRWHTLAEG